MGWGRHLLGRAVGGTAAYPGACDDGAVSEDQFQRQADVLEQAETV